MPGILGTIAASRRRAAGGVGDGTVTWSIVGAPTTDGAQVKARLASADTAQLRVATDTALTANVVTSGTQTPDAFGFVTFDVAGLPVDTVHHYGVEVDSQTSDSAKRGQFRTLPAVGAQHSFSFAHASCQGIVQLSGAGSGFNRPAFRHIAEQTNALFFVFLGDFDYFDVNSAAAVDYRTAYDTQWDAVDLRQLARTVPWVSVWDDHDFLGNGTQGETDATAQANRHVRSAEFRRYFPLPASLPDITTNGAVYRSWVVGRVRFILLDERFYAVPHTNTNSDPAKTMLGDTQEAWLKAEFAEPEPLKIIVHGKPWMKATSGGDDWGAYQLERTAIMDEWQANGVGSLVHLCGDMHGLAASNQVPPYTTDGLGDDQVLFMGNAIRQSASTKGGPYFWDDAVRTLTSVEEIDGGSNHYGLFTVTDNGATIDIAWEGRELTATYPGDGLATVTIPTDYATNGALTKSYPASVFPPASALWYADYDDGTIAQMNAGGGMFHSGNGADAVVATPTRRGTPYALKLSITSDPTVSNGARAHRTGAELDDNPSVYVSSWMYFPKKYTVNNWVMVSQWKANWKTSSTGTQISNDPIWVAEVDNRASGGAPYLFMRFHGEYTGDSIARYEQTLKDIPVGQWTHLEWFIEYSSATAADGHVTFWQDGVQLFDFANVKTHQPLSGTEVAVPHFGWTVYGIDIVDEAAGRLVEVVFDDMVSSTSRVGAG